MKVTSRERGQAMTELALLLGLLLIALIGIMDWSWIMYAHESLVASASLAARWGAVQPYNSTNVSAIKDKALYGRTPCSGCIAPFGLTAANVSVTRLATTYTPEDNGVNITTCQIVVIISGYTVNHFTPIIFGSFTGRPITATYVYENPNGSDTTCTAP